MLLQFCFAVWTVLVLADSNPVPIPGTAECDFFQMRQTRLTDFSGSQRNSCEGEGCRGTTTTTEADQWHSIFYDVAAKCGHPPPVGDNTESPSLPYTSVQKRSYRRACRRAINTGYAHYHGQKLQVTDFPAALVQKLRPCAETAVEALPMKVPRSTRSPRITTLFWNPGGLSQATFLELKQWLRSHPVDLVVIAETRWGFESNWMDGEWSYVHSSSDQRRSGGLLVMIARRLAHPDQIGFDYVFPGRALHIRVHGDTRALDILAIYQFVDYRNEHSMHSRELVWDAIDKCLGNIPSRNNLICAGDFNCDLQAQAPWVGTTSYCWNQQRFFGTSHRDHHRFQGLLRLHGLTALNTWGRSGATFVHGSHATRIDHILTRIISSAGVAKHVRYLDSADFVPCNQSHHVPMLCSIRTHHITYQQYQRPTRCTLAQRNNCRLASIEETAAWHQLRQHVIATVDTSQLEASPEEYIVRIHDQISSAFHSLFPTKNISFPKQDLQMFHKATNDKWFHKRCLRSIQALQGPCHLRSILQAWHHRSRYGVLQRQQQKQARLAKQQRFDQLCQEVDRAAMHHDSHSMFSIINRFTPKRPLARARIKGPDGRIADQFMAHALTVAFVQQMWAGPASLPTYTDCAPGVPFSQDDLTRAIIKLHASKSVAQPFMPAIIWKSAPSQVAESLYQQLQIWWSHSPPQIPQSWKDSWLYFIPKPGKPNTHPSQMRPISLLEPLGKLVLGIIASLIQHSLGPILTCFPHFGFMPNRGAIDAIQRVASHSRAVRALVGSQRRSVIQQMTNTPKLTFCGGLSLFLDMSRAFDCANRCILFDHLFDLGTPPELVQLVASWHEHTRYNLQFHHQTTSVQAGKGLRQGCKIAPQLWVVYMNKFLSLLEAETGLPWIQECLTIYADDIHVGCQFCSPHAFSVHLHNLGLVLDTLERLELQLSYQKSFILLKYAGTNPRPPMKGRIRRQGSEHFLLVPRQQRPPSALPLRSKGSYLGAVISYSAFEQQSWVHRRQSAWLAFTRLRSWLRHRHIAKHQRLYLWKQCVFTVMTYSLLATDVTVAILHDFQKTTYRMIRIILGDHPYRTHSTHMQVFTRHQLDHPLDMLGALAMNMMQRLQRRASVLLPTDFLHRVHWQSLPNTLHLIQCIRASVVEVPISPDAADPVQTQAELTCPHCPFTTVSIANMRRHLTTHHGLRQYRTSSIPPATVALKGAPQCSRCFQVFTTWNSFHIHVQRACCQVMAGPAELPPESAPAMPLSSPAVPNVNTLSFHVMTQAFWPELQRLISRADWTQFPRNADMLEYLTHHCAICGLWCNRFQELHGHFRQTHPDQVQGSVAKGAQLSVLMQTTSPCSLCQRPYSRVHSCPTALQIGMLVIQLRPEEDRPAVACTCDICDLPFPDLGALYGHLTNTHGLTLNDWCPSRDCHQGGDGCRHCGIIFDSRSGLRRHITEGRCEAFNPAATPHPNDTTEKWGPWLQTCNFEPQALTAHMRLQLTNTCQFCGLAYSRTGDLVAHLLQSHGDLWVGSQPWLRFLLQTVMAKRGCLCTNNMS